jgi:hypothetical protein
MKYPLIIFLSLILFSSCKKSDATIVTPTSFALTAIQIDNKVAAGTTYNVSSQPIIKLYFSLPLNQSSINSNIVLKDNSNNIIAANYSYTDGDTVVTFQPTTGLKKLTNYYLQILPDLLSQQQTKFGSNNRIQLITQIDSTDKFPQISDTALLTLVQKQTFNYFWLFGDPTSGMARERNSDAATCATGGTGFGVMATLVAINRNFISYADGLTRIKKIVNFYTNIATSYHGAFSHWINGSTGVTIPFGTQDNGGDIVETSYLMEGLLCARQYFNSTTDTSEINLRNNINKIWNGINWNWYRQNNANVLTWNWSPNYGFVINTQVQGWDEALITYVLAASSPDSSIPKIVYDNGWARNGAMKNGGSYFGYTLPLGPFEGGPLFFEHYSFMGISPKGLSDAYANYDTQTINHSNINYQYCVANPHRYYGYSSDCWGLTASDAPSPVNYNASEPNNDISVISPTAAISSLPYTPAESMQALRFFYYKLGDKLWGQYGFYDAFSLQDLWFANSDLAIDQLPQIVMIENYRTGLCWNLFTSCPEIKTGLKNLGFSAPYL